jgi:putative membrane protein
MDRSAIALRLGFCAAVLVLLAGCEKTPAFGAGMRADGSGPKAQEGSTSSAASLAAESFLDKAVGADIYQLQAAKIATAKARTPDVKAFAQSMADEHATSRALLTDAARQSGQSVPIPSAPTDEQQAMLSLLSRGEPRDFDRTYMEQQVQIHEDTLAVVSAYAQMGAIPSIRTVAGGLEPDLRQDLKKAQMLESGLDTP